MTTVADRSPTAPEDEGSASITVVNAVSAATDTPARDLPPLNEAVDPDALDALFSGRHTSGQVEFRYAGYLVSVHADGAVELTNSC